MSDIYYDFKLILSWEGDNDKGEISVTYPPLSGETTKTFIKLDNYAKRNSTQRNIELGQQIAKLLPIKIREEFERIRKHHKAVRLRFIYPDNEEQRDALLKVPWEYICPPDGPISVHEWPFLALHNNISIVHSIDGYQTRQARAPLKKDQKLKIKYLSHLAGLDEELYESFREELKPIEDILDSKIRSHPAERQNFRTALIDAHIVNLVCHGGSTSISLADQDGFTAQDLRQYILQNNSQPTPLTAKLVLILACHSATPSSHSDTIVETLHQKSNIPMVVGTTDAVHPKNEIERFMNGLYNAFANRPWISLERAVVAGRQTIRRASSEGWEGRFGDFRVFLNGGDDFAIIDEDFLSASPEPLASSVFKKHIENKTKINNGQPEIKKSTPPSLEFWYKAEGSVSSKPWYLVGGEAGSGKSTQIAWWVDEKRNETDKNNQLIYHFCLYNHRETLSALAFVRDSLMPQLKQLYENAGKTEVYQAYQANWPTGKFPRLVNNADDALRYFFIDPLRELKTKETYQPLVIVIDGIDIMPPNGLEESILRLLLDHRDELQEVARFLITVDFVDAEIPGWQRDQAVLEEVFTLTRNVNADWITSPNSQDELKLLKDMQESFGKKSFGNEIYSLDQLLESAVAKAKKDFRGKSKNLQSFLNVVALAREPITLEQVAQIVGISEADKKELIEILLSFMARDMEDSINKPLENELQAIYRNEKLLRLFHVRIKNYILKTMSSSQIAATHAGFVKAMEPKYEHQVNIAQDAFAILPGKPGFTFSEPEPLSSYAKRYLAYHAYESYVTTPIADSERVHRAGVFLNLICDPVYATYRLKEPGLRAFVQDLWNGLRVIYTEYLHSSVPANHRQVKHIFDKLIAANEPHSIQRRRLQEMAGAFKNGNRKANLSAMWKILSEPG